MIIEVSPGTLCVDKQAREWCKLPYPGHPKGCPNYGRSQRCPPKVCHIDELFDLNKQIFFIVIPFNLAAHVKKMKMLHPKWSERQCKCCLYWQGGVRKQLKDKCEKFVYDNPGFLYTDTPEAMGVNVFDTSEKNGLTLERNPSKWVHKIAFAGRLLITPV